MSSGRKTDFVVVLQNSLEICEGIGRPGLRYVSRMQFVDDLVR